MQTQYTQIDATLPLLVYMMSEIEYYWEEYDRRVGRYNWIYHRMVPDTAREMEYIEAAIETLQVHGY